MIRNSPLYLSGSDVDALLTPEMAKEQVREACRCHAAGDYDQPLKPYVRPLGREREAEGGRFITMPAYLGGNVHLAGVKWIAGFPGNIKKGLPRASGVLVLSSADTGLPLAIMDCATVSAMRTAAVVAVCSDQLRVPHGNKVSLLGAGPIIKATIQGLASGLRERDSISIYDLDFRRSQELADSLSSSIPVPIGAAGDAESCLDGADMVVTATTAKSSYVCRKWLDQSRLIVALSFEDCGEEVLLGADKVIVDDFDQCNREEKLIHRLVQRGVFSRERVYAELGQIVSGQLPGRTREDELIYVNPMGMAIEDIAVAAAVYRAALASGAGQRL
jgi:2,3-diaminopropionate biosynthesis protein SbnB